MEELFPEEASVKFMDLVTLLQSIKSEKSIWTSMLLGFTLLSSILIRASCPGMNLVRAGAGADQRAAGTRALKSKGCMVRDSMHPKNGAFPSKKKG